MNAPQQLQGLAVARKLALATGLSLLLAGQAWVQAAPTPAPAAAVATGKSLYAPDRAALRAEIDRIMALVGAGRTEDAFAQIKSRMAVPAVEVDALFSKVSPQLLQMRERNGQMIGHEFISEKVAGKHVVRLIYLARQERNAMTWVFMGYQGSEGWSINSFNFADNPAIAFID